MLITDSTGCKWPAPDGEDSGHKSWRVKIHWRQGIVRCLVRKPALGRATIERNNAQALQVMLYTLLVNEDSNFLSPHLKPMLKLK